MTKDEIIQKLKEGKTILRTENMIFKYGKLVRGSNVTYSLNDVIIKSSQFESLQDVLTRCGDRSLVNQKEYKLKDDYKG